MEIKDYLTPADLRHVEKDEGKLIHKVKKNPFKQNGEIESVELAILGVPFSDINLNPDQSPSKIRKELYELADPFSDNLKIADFGDIKKGQTFYDTLIGLKDVVNYLTEKNIFIIVLGGTGLLKNALTQALYRKNQVTEFVSVEPGISLYSEWSLLTEDIQNQLSYNVIGNQSYYLTKSQAKWLSDKHFQEYRLGNVRSNLVLVEPSFRNAHLSTISINAVKHADAPGQQKAIPNGFYSDEIAQLARFIGLADNTTLFGLFDYFPGNDHNEQTAQLAAQICWFVIEGYKNRIIENPREGQDIKKFIVNQNHLHHELIFYKSDKTERWWMEVPSEFTATPRIMACSYEDYHMATRQEIPDRWLKAFQKHNLNDQL